MRTLAALKLSVPPCAAVPPASCAADRLKSSVSLVELVSVNFVTWLVAPGVTVVVTLLSSATTRLTRRSTRKLDVLELTGDCATPPTEKLTVALFSTDVPATVPAACAVEGGRSAIAVVITRRW